MQEYLTDMVQTIVPMIPEMFTDKINLSRDEHLHYEMQVEKLIANMPSTQITTLPIMDAGMLEFAGEDNYEELLAAMISVGIICAVNAVKPFDNKLIHTRTEYKIVDISNGLKNKIDQIIRESYMMKTDMIEGLRVILSYALESNETTVPDQLLIISDGPASHIINADKNLLDKVQKEYDNAGIRMPTVVFWYFSNVPGDIKLMNNNVMHVDGYSVTHMERVLNGQYY